ncbi:MAG: DUF86 domain-containing protein [Firmicutes bacterium]|nr:DUF86 domain-containing protein [Bacillota bacterium]
MSKRTDEESLNDIREAIQRIVSYVRGMTYETFIADTRTQDAVIRNIEIMGEAAKNLSAQTRARYARIPWRQMAGTRDRLIHNYFGVNIDIVWQIADAELPRILSVLNKIKQERGDNGE